MPYKDPIKQKEYNYKYFKKWQDENKDKVKIYRDKYLSKLTEEQKIRIKEYRDEYNLKYNNQEGVCKCGNKFTGNPKRKYCKECLRNRMKGNKYHKLVKNRLSQENHPNWKGGITFWKKRIWDSAKYKKWRTLVFERDNFTCQKCGINNHKDLGRSVKFEAHHTPIGFTDLLRKYNIKTKEEAIKCDELWSIDLGTTLCFECHQPTKKGRPKK